MGKYLNPPSFSFQDSLGSEIYVDKSALIAFTNRKINTQQKYICVSRPRRFGKSMAADMLAAYYDNKEDTRTLFEKLMVSGNDSFEKHLNKYDVIKIDMQSFMTKAESVEEMIQLLSEYVGEELLDKYPNVKVKNKNDFSEVLSDVFINTKIRFVILIDEWDCVMRRYHSQDEQRIYLDFLRNLMKDQPYIALAYMTGILPIKKYGEHSTLNMFYEYSMIDSAEISDCFGFTEEEVQGLCKRYNMDFEEAREWYDGYHLISYAEGAEKEYSMYSPKSVVESMLRKKYAAYWNQTETYDALKVYIKQNIAGLKDAVVAMLAGDAIAIITRHFQNDMNIFHDKDDILTLLVHLGYLTYDQKHETVSIPNKEVAREFVAAIEDIASYGEVVKSLEVSKELLQALWEMDCDAVAAGVEKAHQQFPAIHYNNENSLSCVIELAFYYAQEYYTVIRELPTGKGFADIVFLPKPKHIDKPAVIIELKWDKTTETALEQIKRKDYPDVLKAYHGNLILCGINYDKDNAAENKKHQCIMEMFEK